MSSTADPIEIVRVTVDAPSDWFQGLARLHHTEIDGGFLASLGAEFLEPVYRAVASSPDAILLAAIANNSVVGLICGAVDTRIVFRQIVCRNFWSLALHVLPRMLSFTRLRRMFETLRYPSQRNTVALPEAEILNFCVASQQQRRGIGRRLFCQLMEEFHSRSTQRIRIVSGEHQVQSHAFYRGLGATEIGRIAVHQGTESLVFIYEVTSLEVVIRADRAA